jgi:hypothetical protein
LSNDPMSPNITSEKLDEIMAAMPDNMEEAEICALTYFLSCSSGSLQTLLYCQAPTKVIRL